MSGRLIPIVVVGARGRMGQALIREVLGSDDLSLVGAVEHPASPGLGLDAGRSVGVPECGIAIGTEIPAVRGAIVVDFSLPDATGATIERCRTAELALVCGTTGLSEPTERALRALAAASPVVWAANFSVGVALLESLATLAVKTLGADWDVELLDLHHRHKRDAPSGTALRLALAIAQARGQRLDECYVGDRSERATGRLPGELGVVALRGGDVVGEHTIHLLGEGERVELIHRATDRAIFARGALRAARWVAGRAAGLYDMADVLGF